MHYTLHQLQVFLKIAQLQSITKASEALNLTQPAVSIQLRNFQDQFPIPLTEVVGRKLYITDFGHEIAETCEKIINELQLINYKTLSFQGQLSGRLRISIVSTAKYMMPYFLTEFVQRHPGIELIIDVTNKSSVIESLEANEIDFAMVSVLPEKLKVHRVELMENRLHLVSSSKLDVKAFRTKTDLLEKVPMIFRESGSATRKAMEDFLSKRGVSVKTKMALTSNEAVKQAVLANLGVSVMPLIGIKNELKNNDLQIIPLRGLPIITTWNLIWLSAKNLSPIALAYLDFLNTKKDEIMKKQFHWVEAYKDI
ncbi:LysR family transcriptional regulator [Gaetbulibacter aestuarii]|uniref:LysR family transcriptional regulator n=1 Tax=Gaetbulibacter aestuarii TaxID=1502358 RepID=A0ABW7MU44_9FLAO